MAKNKDKIELIRHSLAHLMATAITNKHPEVKIGIGPIIENGFYYDFDFSMLDHSPTEENLPKLENFIRELIRKDLKFEREEITAQKAKEIFKNQPFKLELIDELEKAGEKISIYKSGEFVDLCAGPHIESSKEISPDAFKLTKVAGAYWKGSEKNKMLTRVYGVAFESKQELDDYFKMMEEAEKRDHRKLGKELGLFMFHDTAPGMPYWLPNGLVLYNELINFWREEHKKMDYEEISSPLVNKAELWKISGHWDHYKDDMFIADMGENEIYGIKPMNCPNAMVVFSSRQVSYKDLPLRLSDVDRLHRYERSGTLSGLLRVRSFQQDDSHNFITEDMISSEYEHIFEICNKFYGIFGLEYSFRLGTKPDKFLGDIQTWNKAEAELKKILEKSGKKYFIAEGDGAFYGPKIDIIMKDSLGREWQMGTMQLDFQLPSRFDLQYIDKDGKKKKPVVIHRVIYGSLERFIGILIEHTAGNLPVWLSPIQVLIIPVGEKFNDYGEKVLTELKNSGIRAEIDTTSETLGKRIRAGKTRKTPFIIVVGEKEKEAGTIAVNFRNKEKQEVLSVEKFIELVQKEIKDKK